MIFASAGAYTVYHIFQSDLQDYAVMVCFCANGVMQEGLRTTVVVAELLAQPKIRELLRKTKLLRDLACFRG